MKFLPSFQIRVFSLWVDLSLSILIKKQGSSHGILREIYLRFSSLLSDQSIFPSSWPVPTDSDQEAGKLIEKTLKINLRVSSIFLDQQSKGTCTWPVSSRIREKQLEKVEFLPFVCAPNDYIQPLHKHGKWPIFFQWIQTPGFTCFNAYEGSKPFYSAKTTQKPAIFDIFCILLDKKWIRKCLELVASPIFFSLFSAYSKCCPQQELR